MIEAKGLIERHGGSIAARSDDGGKRSRFTTRIPAIVDARPARDRSRRAVDSHTAPTRSNLVADDNEDLVDIVRQSLEAMGHKVTTAPDGAAGLAAYRRELPSIAILDIGMPKLNGFELARAIRREPTGSEVFLIATTGWGAEGDKTEAKLAGFDAHLTKPFEIGRLVALFEDAPVK